MQFDIIDHNVSLTTNIFLVIANIINLFYNIPQMYKTYKCKSTKDFSTLFLSFRFIGNLIWVEYAVEIGSLLMLINNVVTVISTLFIGYYKINELYLEYKIKKNNKKINEIYNENEDGNNKKINEIYNENEDGNNNDKIELIVK